MRNGVNTDKADGRSPRSAALGGAVLAVVLLLAVAAARGRLDGWLLAAAALGIAASGLLLGRGPERARLPRPAASEERLAVAETLVANIPDPVILIDRRTLVIEANDAARALLPALKARQPLSFALRAPDVLDGIDEVLRTGRLLKVEYAERVPAERAFEVQIGALRAPGGTEPSGPSVGSGPNPGSSGGNGRRPGNGPSVMLFFRDLTAARRLEHMRVDFIANASHELRTPLASLLGFIETLQGPARNDPAARQKFLEIMREQAQRMTRLIDDLLSLSRIELRAHVPPAEAIDLLPLVRHMIDTLGPLARESGVAIAFEADEGPLPILGDRDEVLRVVENLIENAVKYGASGGRIEVSARRRPAAEARPAADVRPGWIEFAVRDYGPGIAPEHLPRLTERFYRVDAAESRLKGGTGLGLAIVKHIVARHRGRLAVASDPGEGALFCVSFQIVFEQAASSQILKTMLKLPVRGLLLASVRRP